ncbi:C13 family peptidase [Pontixanthobacter aquaemixtae]|uniref:Peptidase C13 n=1 Tax=Pontixanthobacter aquaemixtae TaxID=1958940 RepID=A0A844ZQ31_9SPHN|nr:C13 family peptidase [Pontixanthobacter aquaemixtae]MXO90451.1 peptidase C13 [Pontixanthobacter aquaemixtae]
MRTRLAQLAITVLTTAICAGFQPAIAQTAGEPQQPPRHTASWPGLGSGNNPTQRRRSLELAPELHRGVDAKEMLRQRRLLDGALDSLTPQRAGEVDVYVLSVALDSDAVFSRETREAANVLSRRYNAAGRTVTLAGPNGREATNRLPRGSITAMTIAIARIAELMDTDEDVLVLYTTTHGAPQGLAYHYGNTGYGILSPKRLHNILQSVGIDRRILIISACYSGVFVPELSGPDTAVVTASTFNRTSFGCEADNDWTFFGDALINRALRKPHSLEAAAKEAKQMITGWETALGVQNSLPQTSIGPAVSEWLPQLEANIPKGATAPTGKLTEVNELRKKFEARQRPSQR